MAIKRYFATKDTTITDAYKSDLATAATGSNAGQSDILEAFSIFGQASAESLERSRILIQFDAATIKASAHVATTKYYLKLFNAEHAQRLPRNFEMSVKPVTSDWEEGIGLDLINYSHSDEASWVGRTSDRIAQVVNVTLNSATVAHYAGKTVSLFDGQDNKFNFFFKTVEESSSTEASGTDVEVDISALAVADNARHRVNLTIPAGNAVAGPSTLRIVLDGAAVPGVDVHTLEVSINGQARTLIPGLIKAAITAVAGAELNGFAAAVDGDGEDAASGALSNLQVQIIGPVGAAVFTVEAVDEPPGLENITISTHLEAIDETVVGILTTTINNRAEFNAVENVGVITVTNVIPGKASAPLSSDWLQKPTLLTTTPGLDYTAWTTPGGDYDAAAEVLVTQFFDKGTENLEIDITTIVNQWIADANPRANYGLGVMLSAAYEDGTKAESYYTKRFFARDSEFFFKRPAIEARWDSALKDDRGKLVTASPFKTNAENTETVYYHNYIDGNLTDLHTNIFDAADDAKNLYFSLTTDKALSQKVTIDATTDSTSIIDVSNANYLNNAFVEFNINNTIVADDDQFIHTVISVSHKDPTTNVVSTRSFVGRYAHWSSADIYTQVYPVNTVNTAENRIAAATGIVEDMNNTAEFAQLWLAVANGEKVKIYSKITGDVGQESFVTLHSLSNTPVDFLTFTGFDAAANAADTLTQKNYAAYQAYATAINVESFGSNAWFHLNAGVDDANNVTLTTKARHFRGNTGASPANIKATKISTGVYKAEFKVAENISATTLYEKWWVIKNVAGTTITEDTGILKGHGGNSPVALKQWYNEKQKTPANLYSLKIMNLQNSYTTGSLPRLRLFIRERNSEPNLVSKNAGTVTGVTIENVYYKLQRMSDGLEVVPYGTGSDNHTLLSYDKEGNYFDLDMSMLEQDYSYGIKFLFMIDGQAEEQKDIFKFRVD